MMPSLMLRVSLQDVYKRQVGHPAEDTYTFEAREIDFGYLQSEDYRKRAARLRGSVMIIGPLLAPVSYTHLQRADQ